MGNQIKLAKLRRNTISPELAERATLGRNTIVKLRQAMNLSHWVITFECSLL